MNGFTAIRRTNKDFFRARRDGKPLPHHDVPIQAYYRITGCKKYIGNYSGGEILRQIVVIAHADRDGFSRECHVILA